MTSKIAVRLKNSHMLDHLTHKGTQALASTLKKAFF